MGGTPSEGSGGGGEEGEEEEEEEGLEAFRVANLKLFRVVNVSFP